MVLTATITSLVKCDNDGQHKQCLVCVGQKYKIKNKLAPFPLPFCKNLVHEGQTHLKIPLRLTVTQTDLLLVEDLHGVMLSRFSVLHQHHSTKRTRAKSFQPLKLLQTSRVLNRKKKKSLVNFCGRGTYLQIIVSNVL